MRTIFIILLLACTMHARANDSLWLSLWKKAPVVVEAKIVERGRCVRMEDGMIYCDLVCVVTQYYKGHVAVGDTIRLKVIEFSELNLGGKLQVDPIRYEEGKDYVFFLKMIYHNRFRKGSLYSPVDDWHGALVPTVALRTWLVNDIGDPR